MSAIRKTLQFFSRYLKKRYTKLTIISHQVKLENAQDLIFDEYIPSKKIIGTVVFTHGMTRSAYKDPRIVDFCKAMASCGYRMLVPLFPKIKALDVSVDSVNDIADSLRYFIEKKISTEAKLAVFSVSFSGAQALRAMTSDDINSRVCAFLALGTAHNYLTTFEKILDPTGPAEAYVKMLMLHNVLQHSDKAYTNSLKAAINSAIDDAYENNDPNNLAQHKNNLPIEEQAYYEKLINQLFNTKSIYHNYLETIQKLQTDFECSGDLSKLSMPISLIHSTYDRVLMPEESKVLFANLQNNNVPTKLTITGLMDHVNTQFSIKQVKQAWQLLKGFEYFFKHIKH